MAGSPRWASIFEGPVDHGGFGVFEIPEANRGLADGDDLVPFRLQLQPVSLEKQAKSAR